MTSETETRPRWIFGNLFLNPPRLHECRRCGALRVNMDLHDEWHAEATK